MILSAVASQLSRAGIQRPGSHIHRWRKQETKAFPWPRPDLPRCLLPPPSDPLNSKLLLLKTLTTPPYLEPKASGGSIFRCFSRSFYIPTEADMEGSTDVLSPSDRNPESPLQGTMNMALVLGFKGREPLRKIKVYRSLDRGHAHLPWVISSQTNLLWLALYAPA